VPFVVKQDHHWPCVEVKLSRVKTRVMVLKQVESLSAR